MVNLFLSKGLFGAGNLVCLNIKVEVVSTLLFYIYCRFGTDAFRPLILS